MGLTENIIPCVVVVTRREEYYRERYEMGPVV